MYFRNKKTRTGTALQLVESFRDNEGKPKQKIILSLGNIPIPQHLWKEIAKEIENQLKGILTFLEVGEESMKWVDLIMTEIQKKGWSPARLTPQFDESTIVEVDISQISHHTTTELGPELVALKAWDSLDISKILQNIGFNPKQIKNVAISVMNRLLDPCSENALPKWLNTTSFEDLFQCPMRDLSKDLFYRISDKLIKNKERIENELRAKETSFFNLSQTIYLYDVTNTYFEGQCLQNPSAKRGNSKEKRTDAPLLSMGMVLDTQGFLVRHEVFPGNLHDSLTLISMIKKLQKKDKNPQKPMIIMDSGIASEENLKQLKDSNYDYIVTGKRPLRIAYEKDFQELPFSIVNGREGKAPVQIAVKDEKEERIVLCYSEKRSEKEKGILSKAEEKYLQDIDKLSKRLDKGRLKSRTAAERALGRLMERHPRVNRYYKTEITEKEDLIHLNRERLDEKYNNALQVCGGYYLRCSRKDLSAEEIWKIYMMLTRVETGFRTLKSDLGLRPVYHQKEHRCEGHIFITILAYHLLQWIEHGLRIRGEYMSWASVRRLLQTHAYTTITCPSKDGKVHHIRTPGTPDSAQSKIYDLLNIDVNKLPRPKTIL